MQVKYSVKESTIPNGGKGLFAEQFIPKGSLIWKFDRDNVAVYTRKGIETYLASLPYEEACKYAMYIYGEVGAGKDCAVYELDDGRYFNHSDTPNVVCKVEGTPDCFATRDIQKGEELFVDYHEFDEYDWIHALKDKYSIWGPHKPIKSKL
eukprot:CAMPEP_0197027688 /NCGR_PEP_ID=MMETSP1384-20130603/7561_1 /TAXON_ID=29189 /ORGANISM="Ammonia sp." /LENGTH=150 /DNA_ID=CAMNT_0042456571 /DNA_START=121 /DNA_END=573 /DNA_ORIENTATION=-